MSFGFSFAGQDNRLNNMTIDGSYFNNSFGLAGQPGDRVSSTTNQVTPISLDALEQVQVAIAPYDVRQGNFVGAGINMVTKSGGNQFTGSMFYNLRSNDYVGTHAGPNPFNPGTFDYKIIGVSVGGPIIKNRLFFFGSYEDDHQTAPDRSPRTPESADSRHDHACSRPTSMRWAATFRRTSAITQDPIRATTSKFPQRAFLRASTSI
jgi:hypothetical protein